MFDKRSARPGRRAGLYTYPDIIVVCDEPKFEDRMFDTLLNPRVLMEVLVRFHEGYDRGDEVQALSANRVACRSTF